MVGWLDGALESSGRAQRMNERAGREFLAADRFRQSLLLPREDQVFAAPEFEPPLPLDIRPRLAGGHGHSGNQEKYLSHTSPDERFMGSVGVNADSAKP